LNLTVIFDSLINALNNTILFILICRSRRTIFFTFA